MRTNKKALASQRQIVERKMQVWIPHRMDKIPPSGWIKATRGALGITTTQLAELMSVDQSNIVRMEKREAQGKVTLDVIKKAAQAMNCKLVYAIVPDHQYPNIESIIDERAHQVATHLSKSVEHSMRLEKQGVDSEITKKQIDKIANDLKTKMDSLLWDKVSSPRQKKKK